MEALGVLDVDGLHIAVQLLLGTLLVVSSSGNADADAVRNALDALLPDLLVQLGVQANVRGTLRIELAHPPSIVRLGAPSAIFLQSQCGGISGEPYHSLGSEVLDLLDGAGGPLLESNTVELESLLATPHFSKQSDSDVFGRSWATYPLVHVDGVLAGDNVRNGGALRLAGRLLSLGRHFCGRVISLWFREG